MKKLLVLFLGVFMASCGSFSFGNLTMLNDNFARTKYDPELAYVFMRADYLIDTEEALVGNAEDSFVHFLPADQPALSTDTLDFPPNTFFCQLPENDAETIVVFTIRPGSYRVGTSILSRHLDLTKYTNGFLDIVPGEVVYLGDFTVRAHYENKGSYRTSVFGDTVTVIDFIFDELSIDDNFEKTAQDLGAFNPNFKGLEYRNQLIF